MGVVLGSTDITNIVTVPYERVHAALLQTQFFMPIETKAPRRQLPGALHAAPSIPPEPLQRHTRIKGGWLTRSYNFFSCASFFPIVFNLQKKVYKYPDLWVCLYKQYGCDSWELEEDCVASAWKTEGGPPNAVFYPRETLGDLDQTTTDELPIKATGTFTNKDEVSLAFPRTTPACCVVDCCHTWWCCP